MKAVIYHYVRPADPWLPYFRNLHVDDFARQLDHFAQRYRLVERDEFLDMVTHGHAPPADTVLLTFDDGFSDHYQYVLPELKRRGLWGIFFVSTGVYAGNDAMDVHKVHYLLGRHGGETMLRRLRQRLSPEMLVPERVAEFGSTTYRMQTNSDSTADFKRTLNYFVSPCHRAALLRDLMSESERADALADLYLTPAMVRQMQDEGMVIGSHTVTHPILSTLALAEQAAEINDSFRFLEEITEGLAVRTFCYPYGGLNTFTSDTERLLDEARCAFSFTGEARDITAADTAGRRQALPRFDCNVFPFGQCRPAPGDCVASHA